MKQQQANILLCDNGSRRPQATRSLRTLAKQLSEASGKTIHPVSLQHANKISADQLGAEPAQVLEDFLSKRLQQGERDFLILPLFFGPSRAISSFIPQTVEKLTEQHGSFNLQIAQELCPLPGGEPLLVDILADHTLAARKDNKPDIAILVDHGSPIPEVTAVRQWLGQQLQQRLPHIHWQQAVMERREGKEYDFNGELLEDVLKDIASTNPHAQITLSMLFLNPGRHAGTGGDIEQICQQVREHKPHINIDISPLVGEHPAVIDILQGRIQSES